MIRKLTALAALCVIFTSCNNVFLRIASNDTEVMVVNREGQGYVVTFDKNNSDDGSTEADPQTKTVNPPAAAIDRLPEPPARPGYTFNGWNTAADGSGTSFSEATAVNSAIVVYAQWR